MKYASNDPRARRTRQALRDGLMQTVIIKPFRDITIRDITACAEVNRATFYLHYADKYDLLEDCAENLLLQVRQEMEQELGMDADTPPPMPSMEHGQRMLVILRHFQQHKEFYLAMLGKNGDPMFYTLFRDGASAWIQSLLTTLLESQNRSVETDFIEMMVRFQSAGNFDVVMWWLEHDMPVPIDVMAERLSMITLPPLIRLIQGDDN